MQSLNPTGPRRKSKNGGNPPAKEKATKRPRRNLWDRKQLEAARVSCLSKLVGVSFWPNAWSDADPVGSKENAFAVTLDSDLINEIWVDWRDAPDEKLSIPVAAELLRLSRQLEQIVAKFERKDGFDRATTERVLAAIIAREDDE